MELFDFESDFLSLESPSSRVVEEIKWVATHKKIEFKERLFILQKFKTVKVRRLSAKTLFNFINHEDLTKINDWQNGENDRQTWLILESLKDFISLKNDNNFLDKTSLSVGEALFLIKQNLGVRNFTIEGEISEINIYNNNFPAMYYAVLKDNDGQTLRMHFSEFVVSKLNFSLNLGLSVRVVGRFKISKNANLFLDVTKIDLTGEGVWAKNLKDLQKKLENEGLFDPFRKRKVPRFCKKVLLIASPQSAALSDYQKVLGQRIGGVKIFLLPIKTQGVSAEKVFLEKMKQVADLHQKYHFDVCVITRGGGAKEDLILFNSEMVVRSIYALPIPSIVAIGHERDITLAELVADLRASTPSQAAEMTSFSKREILNETDLVFKNIHKKTHQKHANYNFVQRQIWQNILKISFAILYKYKLLLKNNNWQIINALQNEKQRLVKNQRQICLQVRQKIPKNIQIKTLVLREKVESSKTLTRKYYEKILWLLKEKMRVLNYDYENCMRRIENENPQKILQMGYVKISQKNVKIGQKIYLENLEKKIECEVRNIYQKP